MRVIDSVSDDLQEEAVLQCSVAAPRGEKLKLDVSKVGRVCSDYGGVLFLVECVSSAVLTFRCVQAVWWLKQTTQ